MSEKRNPGRPPIKYDPEFAKQIQAMAQYGLPQDKIAIIVDMAPNTLRKLYMNELEKGRALANLAVGKKFFERCMAGDVPCLIFYLKAQLGWQENSGKKETVSAEDAAKKLADAIRAALNSVGN